VTDGCSLMPLAKDTKFTVMSFGLPTSLADMIPGFCSIESENAVGLCVAFGECDGGLPTFAIQMTGPAAGCMAANPEVAAATGGIGELIGEVASLGLKSIGFGLSASGAFQMDDLRFWGGTNGFSTSAVTTSGNIYQTIGVSIEGAVPEAVADYFEVGGVMTVVTQLGNGDMESEVKTIYSDLSQGSPLAAIKALAKASLMGQFKITVAISLADLTDNALANLELGNVFEVDGMLTTQTMSGLSPGAYFYASAGLSMALVMEDAMDWVVKSFGDIINKIAGNDNVAENAVKAVTKVLGTPDGKQAFGFYASETSMGIMMTFPVGSLFGFLGVIPMGTMSMECQFHYDHGGATCGLDYGEPKWAAAVWKDAQMVIGPILASSDEAIESLKAGATKDWTVLKGGVEAAYVDIAGKAKADIAKAEEKKNKLAARAREDKIKIEADAQEKKVKAQEVLSKVEEKKNKVEARASEDKSKVEADAEEKKNKIEADAEEKKTKVEDWF